MKPLATKPVCAWLSRHPPHPEMRRSLQAYSIVVLPDRWSNAKTAYARMLQAITDRPALVVAIMPDDMLVEFVSLIAPTPVIRPKQAFGDLNHWTGKWEQIGAVTKPTYTQWIPGEVKP